MPSCPHCGFTVEAGAVTCPLCGSRIGGGREGDGGAGGPGEAPGAERTAGGRLAWEDPAEPFLGSLVDAWRTSTFEPTRFYRSVSWEGSFARPLLYFLIAFVTAALFASIWQAVYLDTVAREMMRAWGFGSQTAWSWNGGTVLLRFFLSPFYGLVVLGISTVVFHVFVLVLAPRRRGIGATARALCYSMGPAVFAIVPFLGPLAAWLVWIPILQVIGLREAHRTTTGRALAVWLAPMVLLFLVSIAFAVLVVMMLGRASGGPGVLRRI